MIARARGYAHRIDINASPERVWRALTETAPLARWCAPDATIRARQGGQFAASVDRVESLEALIDIYDPRRRLRLIHMPRADLPAHDSALVDDFLVEHSGATTIVRLLGSGFPEDRGWDAYYLRLRTGWERALARLKVFLEKHMDEVSA